MMKTIIRWNLTNKCRLNCLHCYNKKYRESFSDVALRDKITIVNKLPPKNVLIKLSGGEPFDDPSLLDVCNKLDQREIEFGLTTNGNFDMEKYCALFELASLKFLTFSLDGINEEQMVLRKGGDVLEKARKNILNLRKHYPSIRIAINMLLTKRNYLILNNILNTYFNKWEVDKVCISELQPTNILAKNLKCNKNEISFALQQVKEFKNPKRNKIYNIELDIECSKKFKGLICEEINLDYYCGAGRNMSFIDSSGYLLPCESIIWWKWYSTYIDSRYNLLKNDYWDILDLPMFHYAYHYNLDFREGNVNKYSDCYYCSFKKKCARCPFYDNKRKSNTLL